MSDGQEFDGIRNVKRQSNQLVPTLINRNVRWTHREPENYEHQPLYTPTPDATRGIFDKTID